MRRRLALSLILVAALAGYWALGAQVQGFQPVTEQMLRDPAPGDWLNWRRTDDAWGYSPLDQIDRSNVGQLQLAWSWAIDDTGSNQASPLVYNGVMYLPNPRGVIQALDAATGDLIWEYRPGQENADVVAGLDGDEDTVISRLSQAPTAAAGEGRGIQRNLAIFGNNLYGTTNDAHVVAIDARTGALVWDTRVADHELGYEYTSGPIVVRGKVIAGITGCGQFKEDVCFIAAHDAETGAEVWRTSTVARPGEPGGDTWGDLPLAFRAGSDAWIPGSYDPQANLLYWGTAQAKPWAREARGTDGDALYTNSTLALDPDTGRMVWYYQHIPGESQDMDEAFENILIDTGGRKSLFKMGKIGILWELDRITGEFIRATDLGYQNIIDVEPSSGQVTYREGKLPHIGEAINMCPSTSGLKSWRAMSYSPQTNAVYIPLNLNCEIATFGEGPAQVLGDGGTGAVRRRDYVHPDSGGNLGEFLALDITTGDVLWRHRTPSPSNTAALATAGGIVFGGDWDRHMYAYDARSGEILWQTRLTTSAQGFPVTYLANGQQYVAMPAGIGGGSWSTLIAPELAPQIRRPNSGNSLMVFALPGATAPPANTTSRSNTTSAATVAAAARSASDGVYSSAQAQRGQAEYTRSCISCHGADLTGSSVAPSIAGDAFSFNWGGAPVGDLFTRVRSQMPPDRPGGLSDPLYRDLVAFILETNGFPSGDAELPAGVDALNRIQIPEN